MKKTRVIISAYQPIVFRNLFILDFFRIAEKKDIDIFLVTNNELAGHIAKEGLLPNTTIIVYEKLPLGILRVLQFIRKRIFKFIFTHNSRNLDESFSIKFKICQLIQNFIIFFEKMFSLILYYDLRNDFKKLNFDCYINTVPTTSDEAHIFYTAKAIGLKCICSIKALDNLTKSKFLVGNFDRYCVWNKWQSDTLVRNYNININSIYITGAPQPLRLSMVNRNKQVFKNAKIFTRQKILYCCSPEDIFSDDVEILSQLINDFHETEFIIRLHPADTNYDRFKGLKESNRIKVYGQSSDFRGSQFLSSRSFDEFAEQLKTSSLCICLASTIIIDALAAHVLPISIRFSLTPNGTKVDQMIWYQQEHIKKLCSDLSFPVVDSYSELVKSLKKYHNEEKRINQISANYEGLNSLIGASADCDILEVVVR